MPGDDSTSTTPQTAPRPGKQRSRAASPPPSGSGEQSSDSRPPTKRARKAVNCEACRASKLKCDRNRPCSSCVLRGTTAHCYQDGRGNDGPSNQVRGHDSSSSQIDPATEIARLRQSVAALEAYIFPNRNHLVQSSQRPREPSNPIFPKTEVDADGADKAPPGMLGNKEQGGLYTGPTSAATHLILGENRGSEDAPDRPPGQEQTATAESPTTHDYDRDLLTILPPLETIDELVTYYFEYCNWIYRHVNQNAFMEAWGRFKAGQFPDRIVFSTVCLIMAVAVHYLPTNHSIFEHSSETHGELGDKYYDVMRTAMQRHHAESRAYSLELVELTLIRSHYLYLSKKDTEEIWTVRGELITIGVAMGLHRDPGKWKMPLQLAERRRWAWWHIILLERWQAFMFGRPISIASHCFDTELPSYCDPAIDRSGRLYLPNIALFRLAYILGDIMSDAVSLRQVPYESVQKNDRALSEWMDNLPSELALDEYRIARSLASPIASVRRLGVQSVIIRTSYYHIRFTLHRPYATAPVRAGKADPSARVAQSLETAVGAADKLITMVQHAQPDFFNNAALAVPGHMNWGPFHVFSASMFFSFQLISNPDQPGATLFRANIRKAMNTLEMSNGLLPLASKALNILNALAPLYSPEFPQQSAREREKMKASVLAKVKSLAFPYHDSPPYPRASLDSPSARQASSPANSNSLSPPGMGLMLPPQQPSASAQQQGHSLPPMSSMRSMSSGSQQQLPSLAPYTHPPPLPPPHMHHGSSLPQHQQQISPVNSQPQSMGNFQQGSTPSSSYSSQQAYQMTQQPTQQQLYGDTSRYQSYVHPADDEIVFGASAGMNMGEWAWFRDYTQRPDTATRPPA